MNKVKDLCMQGQTHCTINDESDMRFEINSAVFEYQ